MKPIAEFSFFSRLKNQVRLPSEAYKMGFYDPSRSGVWFRIEEMVFSFLGIFFANSEESITNRFSAFPSSADLVKLNQPEITVRPSMIMILLCAILCFESMKVGILALERKVADEYFSVFWLLSKIA